MAGITDRAFRETVRGIYCDYAFTEMISIMGIRYNNAKTLRYFDNVANEPNVGVQLFGYEPDALYDACKFALRLGIKHIDLNMGCPAPKITRNHEGGALLKAPDVAEALIKAAVASGATVSVKTRLGYNTKCTEAINLCNIAKECGVTFVSLHGRTVSQGYRGTADYDAIAEVVRNVDLPVVGNGDIRTRDDYLRMMDTGAYAVMVGRGAMHAPWILGEVAGHTYDLGYKRAAAYTHIALLHKYKPDTAYKEVEKFLRGYRKIL